MITCINVSTCTNLAIHYYSDSLPACTIMYMHACTCSLDSVLYYCIQAMDCHLLNPWWLQGSSHKLTSVLLTITSHLLHRLAHRLLLAPQYCASHHHHHHCHHHCSSNNWCFRFLCYYRRNSSTAEMGVVEWTWMHHYCQRLCFTFIPSTDEAFLGSGTETMFSWCWSTIGAGPDHHNQRSTAWGACPDIHTYPVLQGMPMT